MDGLQAVGIAAALLRSQLEVAAERDGLTFTWGEETGLTAEQVCP
ncbi:hypothetical protein [Streptomyces sp. H34-S4]|nr:hypothetical protein [Streptomyces sp. H34-S4]MCY0935144.1 hypothetical protein [Streptomyces sp. H34-S4]